MMTPNPARQLLKDLQTRFAVFRDALPLAIGIDEALRTRIPDINRRALRDALRHHTGSTRYLKGLQAASQRFDLDGQPAGDVTDVQRKLAADTLKERFKKAAQIRKEQAEAAAAAARSQQKLSELVAKFSK